MVKIKNDVLNILANSKIEGNNLILPNIQLERKLYMDINKVLLTIGGKWNRKEKAHIFGQSPINVIDKIILSGEYTDSKKEYQFFETPENLAQKLIEMANIKEEETVLEPSAGQGKIAQFIKNCDCIELNDKNRQYLKDNNYNIVGEDFLTFNNKYDVIIANPPFTKQQDIDHVLHMIKLAKRRIVSIMSSSIIFRDNKKTVEFRELIDELGGTIEELPEQSFKESGTNVNTCIVCVDIKENIN